MTAWDQKPAVKDMASIEGPASPDGPPPRYKKKTFRGKRYSPVRDVPRCADAEDLEHLPAHLANDRDSLERTDYTDDEREFLTACAAYRTAKRVSFLTARDFLRVLLSLGYRKEHNMAFNHNNFNDQLPHGRQLRRAVNQSEEGDEGIADTIDTMTQMCEGGDTTVEANFTEVTVRYGFASNAKAKAAFDDLTQMNNKTSTNASVTNVKQSRGQVYSRMRG